MYGTAPLNNIQVLPGEPERLDPGETIFVQQSGASWFREEGWVASERCITGKKG